MLTTKRLEFKPGSDIVQIIVTMAAIAKREERVVETEVCGRLVTMRPGDQSLNILMEYFRGMQFFGWGKLMLMNLITAAKVDEGMIARELPSDPASDVSVREVIGFIMQRSSLFRQSVQTKAFVTEHHGALITAELSHELLNPFAVELVERFPRLRGLVDTRLTEFAADALAHIHHNYHMNNIEEGENTLSDRTADALVVGFCNDVSIPADLGMYTSDLYK